MTDVRALVRGDELTDYEDWVVLVLVLVLVGGLVV